MIGRSSKDSALVPDINLAPQGADDLGVSRLHVALRYDANDNILYVYDLISANGTYINSQRLHAREMRLLRNGDILQLGRLALQIQFLR